MKISVCGKGGCGKSTVSALLAKSLLKMDYRVLVVDADESNFGLHRLLGMDLPENVMDSLGGKKGFNQKMNELRKQSVGEQPNLFGQNWTLSEIPDEYALEKDGLKLLLVGKVHHFAEGCACPMGALSKMIMKNIELADQEAVVVDTEAGTEHFGRGLEGECDVILSVVDPTYESFLLAEKIMGMSQNAGKPVFFLLNKVTPELEKTMLARLDPGKVVGGIYQSESLFRSSLSGEELREDIPEMDRVCQMLLDKVVPG